MLGLVIFSAGLFYILNRKEGFSFKKTYSTNEIKDAINLQSELYYDPVNYFVYNEDIQLVDIRRKENFQNEHINTSLNIPAEIDKTNPSEFSNKKELIEAFQKLDSKKDIVILGENSNSLVPIHVAGVLAEKQIRVKIMTIGWNEFRNLQTFWLPEQLWGKVNIMDFVESN
jgi:rhodanese-related sulfurtransferase